MLFDAPPEPPPPSSVSRPLIGLAISICLGVVSLLTGFIAACGPGRSSDASSPSAALALSAVAICSLCVFSAIGFFIWLIIIIINNSSRR